MSITDELREWAVNHRAELDMGQLYPAMIHAIADRIDAAHEESIQRDHENAYDVGYAEGMGVANKADMRAEYLRGKNDGYDEGWDVGFASADDWLGQHEDAMAEHGWVRLPKDADGEYIRIGDVMEWVRYEDDDPTIVRKVSAVGAGVFFAWSDEQGRYAQYEAHAYRHYHAPTVEDVLREFAEGWDFAEGAGKGDSYMKTFSAKLRLAGDAE